MSSTQLVETAAAAAAAPVGPAHDPSPRAAVAFDVYDLEVQFSCRHEMRTPVPWRVLLVFQRSWRKFVRNALSFRGARIGIFLVLCGIWAVCIFLFERLIAGGLQCGFVDALFLAVSSLSATGLVTVDFSRVTLATQILTLVGFVLGSLWFRTIIPVVVKIGVTKHHFAAESLAHRCMVLVVLVVLSYSVFFLFVMSGLFAVYSLLAPEVSSIFWAYDIQPWYGGYYLAVSAFANAGFSPFPNSVMPFAADSGFLVYLVLFMLAGGVAFPLVLRLIVSGLARLNIARVAAEHLLEKPREYYSVLFTWKSTMIVMSAWLMVGVVDFALTLGLEWDRTLSGTPIQQIIQAVFASVSIRITGLTAMDISKLRAALVIVYIFELYLSNNPIFIEMRATTPGLPWGKSPWRQLKWLILSSVLLISFSWLLLALLESGNAAVGDNAIGMLFELCSAFGTVGLSQGTPGTNLSFCGSFTIAGKLLIMAMMIVGSHRDLPLYIEPSVSQLSHMAHHTHVHAIAAGTNTRQFITRASTF